MKTVNGKKPLSSKPQNTYSYTNYQANLLDIPAEIKAQLIAKGLEGRWINYKRFVDDGNFHKEGWVPFKSESPVSGVFGGTNPDGLVRRKELVLACRAKEICESHRAFNRDKLDKAKKKSAARELRDLARSGGLRTTVVDDGVDDNE